MTVSQDFPVTRRPFSPGTGPGLPIGYWAGHSGVLGDASGGAIHNIFRFAQLLSPGSSLIYSLDELRVSSTFNLVGATLVGLMEVLSMDFLPLNGGTGGQFTWTQLIMPAIGAQRNGNAMTLGSFNQAIFLGAAIPSTSARLLFEIENNVGQTLSVKCGGYYWEAGAINAPGGLRRPIDGLYASR